MQKLYPQIRARVGFAYYDIATLESRLASTGRTRLAYKNIDGIADFHAAGRHTYITQLIKSGAPLPTAMELARHSDAKMTMRYTHIGIDDQADALKNLPAPTCKKVRCTGAAFPAAQRVLTWHKLPLPKNSQSTKNAVSLNRCQTSASLINRGSGPLRRRARDSNPQPLTGHFISNEAASHSLTLHSHTQCFSSPVLQ